MKLIAENGRRVESLTSHEVNQRIQDEMEERVASLAGKPTLIRARLRALDKEWDIERCLETGSATLTLAGLGLGFMKDRRWFLLSVAVQGFFMQHAMQGWCPPLPVFRRLGVRTQREIESERHALKALLGEYGETSDVEKRSRVEVARRVFRSAIE